MMANRGAPPHSHLYEKMLELEEEPSGQELIVSRSTNQGESEQRVEMVIEYGADQTGSLLVGPADDPQALAQCFCFQHDIDPRIIATLAHNIASLQASTFHRASETSFKLERNDTHFDDKENRSSHNVRRSGEKSHKREASRVREACNESGMGQSRSRVSTGGRSNVFERLYQQSRQSSRVVERLAQSRTTQGNKSLNESSIRSCLHIYEKNRRLQEQARRHQEQQLQERQRKELQGCRFKPQINNLSNLIACKLRELDQQSVSRSDRQLTKIKEYLLKREEAEMKECTFQPSIISRTPSSAAQQRHRQPHKRTSSREHQKTEQHQPHINSISRIIVKKGFFERLEADTQKRSERRESQGKQAKREGSAEKRPATGRPPANRDLGDKTVGEYLYEKAKVGRGLPVKEQPKILTDPRSSQIHACSKRIAFQYLFELLDHDQDGLISSTKINIASLDQEVLRLLAPLLSEMEDVEVELNAQEFQQAFERLFSTLSVHEKDVILKCYKNKGASSRAEPRPSFHPTLNEKSLLIARELTGEDSDIYSSSVAKWRNREGRLARLRAEKMLDEYSECTFQPNLMR